MSINSKAKAQKLNNKEYRLICWKILSKFSFLNAAEGSPPTATRKNLIYLPHHPALIDSKCTNNMCIPCLPRVDSQLISVRALARVRPGQTGSGWFTALASTHADDSGRGTNKGEPFHFLLSLLSFFRSE